MYGECNSVHLEPVGVFDWGEKQIINVLIPIGLIGSKRINNTKNPLIVPLII